MQFSACCIAAAFALLSISSTLWAADPGGNSDSKLYFITLPKALLLENAHKFSVKVDTVPAVIRIDTTDPTSQLTVTGNTILLENTLSDIPYQIPFAEFGSESVTLHFYVDVCDDPNVEKCKDKEVEGKYLSENVTLSVMKENFIIFSETSKPIYKPGELVQFRFLPVYPTTLKTSTTSGGYMIKKTKDSYALVQLNRKELKKVQTERLFEIIYLEDPNQVRMQQWKNVTWETAMNLSYQLSKDPVMGKWKLVAKFSGQTEEDTFDVKKYVLPKFTVDLNPPDNIIYSDKKITYSVCAQYSTGKPMKAIIRSKLCIESKYTSSKRMKRPCIEEKARLDGTDICNKFSIDSNRFHLDNKDYKFWDDQPVLTADVEEVGTGMTLTKSATGRKLEDRRFKMEIEGNDFYKPGLPYYGKILTKTHNDAPYPNAEIEVSIISFSSKGYWGFTKVYRSDAKGMINFSLPPIPINEELGVNAREIVKEEERREGKVVVYSTSAYKRISPWISTYNVSLQVYPRNLEDKSQADCPSEIRLRLQSNTPLTKRRIYVNIVSRGQLVTSGVYDANKNEAKECTDQDGELGHYTCVGIKGKKILLKCREGWTGDDCLQPVCDIDCNNGVCVTPGKCSCRSGWKGENCSDCIPRSGCKEGVCKYGDDCQCLPGWTGWTCNRRIVRPLPLPSIPPPPPLPTKSIDGSTVESEVDIVRIRQETSLGTSEKNIQEKKIFERDIRVNVDRLGSPDTTILVYYVQEGINGSEIVASSFSTSDLNNCVVKTDKNAFKFDKTETAPGSEVYLRMFTNASNSKCSLRISDVSLKNFGSSGGVELNTLIEKLIQINSNLKKGYFQNNPFNDLRTQNCGDPFFPYYNWNVRQEPMPRQRKRRSFMPYSQVYDSAKAFEDSGVFAITNGQYMTCRSRDGYRQERRYNVQGQPVPMLQGEREAVDIGGGEVAEDSTKNKKKEIKIRLREFFPETWKFDYRTNPLVQTKLTAPDAITTWKADAYCMTEMGLWVAPSTYLTVLLPFYAQLTLPYSVKFGETLNVPVKLFNYLSECYEIQVEMTPTSQLQVESHQSVTTCLCDLEQKTVYFKVRPNQVGLVNVTVTAKSTESNFCYNKGRPSKQIFAGDAVKRQLLVEPEGIPDEITIGDLVCLDKENVTITNELTLPEKIVPNSLRIYAIFSGDVMGSTLTNLENLVRMPYGCGEQNMVSMVPSIYVLDYFKSAKIDKPDVMENAKKYIGIGYKRQLNYMRDDGSFSAFGKSDKEGSTWLTAFVLKSFIEAKRYVEIDPQILSSAVAFLIMRQDKNGCFVEKGKVFSSSMKGGMGKDGSDSVLLTAYVLTALEEVDSGAYSTDALTKSSIKCVKASINKGSTTRNKLSNYSLALIARALSIHERDDVMSATLRSNLLKRAMKTTSTEFWTDQSPEDRKDSGRFWIKGTSSDVETTAYAYLTLEDFRPGVESMRAIRWLSTQKNSIGGFYSTQDTVMGLKALSSFAQKLNLGKKTNIFMNVKIQDFKKNDQITDDNRLVTRKVEIPNVYQSTPISWSVSGSGCAFMQAALLFNLPKPVKAINPFTLITMIHQNDPECNTAIITACFTYRSAKSDSGMLLLTVNMISGWQLTNDFTTNVDRLIREDGLKRADVVEGKVSFYYDPISKGDNALRCMNMEVYQEVVVENTKEGSISVMDYYNPEILKERQYSLRDCVDSSEVKPVDPPVNNATMSKCPQCFSKTSDVQMMDKVFEKFICNSGKAIFAYKQNTADYALYMAKGDEFYQWPDDLPRDHCGCVDRTGEEHLIIVAKKSWQLVPAKGIEWTEDVLVAPLSSLEPLLRVSDWCPAVSTLKRLIWRLVPDSNVMTPPIAIEPPESMCPICLNSVTPDELNVLKDRVCAGYQATVSIINNNTTWSLTELKNKDKSTVFQIDASFGRCECDIGVISQNFTQPIWISVRQEWKIQRDEKRKSIRPDGDFLITNEATYLKLISTCDSVKPTINSP